MDLHDILGVSKAAIKLAITETNKEEAAKLLKSAHGALNWRDKERFGQCICGDAEFLGNVACTLDLPEVVAHVRDNTYCPELRYTQRPSPLRPIYADKWLIEWLLKEGD